MAYCSIMSGKSIRKRSSSINGPFYKKRSESSRKSRNTEAECCIKGWEEETMKVLKILYPVPKTTRSDPTHTPRSDPSSTPRSDFIFTTRDKKKSKTPRENKSSSFL